jgi:hypothetical protein
MSKSRRHHYVPQFLTGHFAIKDKIFAYDKKENNYFIASPINLFLKKDRNTFLNHNGIEDDVVEQMYASIDALFSSILTTITTSAIISNDNYKLLLLLAYITKWRVPQYDKSFKSAREYFTVDDLGLGFKDSNNERLDIELEAFFNLDMSQEIKRILLPLQPFRFKEDFKKLLENSFIISTPYDAFIGDCVFNEIGIESEEIIEDFVFPFTRDLTLVYSTRIDRNKVQNFLADADPEKVATFLRDFSTARDVSTLDLAERFVACGNEDYFKSIVEGHKNFKAKGTGTPFSLTVFSVLYRFEEYAASIEKT